MKFKQCVIKNKQGGIIFGKTEFVFANPCVSYLLIRQGNIRKMINLTSSDDLLNAHIFFIKEGALIEFEDFTEEF